MNEPSITCPRCGMTSYHPDDIKYRYCDNCKQFHDDMQEVPAMLHCAICGKLRTIDRLLVATKDPSPKFGLPAGSTEESILYCDDNAICALKVKTFSHFTGKEWKANA